jgi:hypothetical protein
MAQIARRQFLPRTFHEIALDHREALLTLPQEGIGLTNQAKMEVLNGYGRF